MDAKEELSGKRILIIDDIQAERQLLGAYLQQQGCRVYQAEDGVDGIHKARVLQPDLILLDTQMPVCDGYNACRLLSEDVKTSHIPVIFISGLTSPEQRTKGLLAGAVDYIQKPYHFDEVKLRLLIHLRANQKTPKYDTQETPENNDVSSVTFDHILFHSARVHLLKSFSETPSLKELARLSGTNTKRLNQAFKACSGMTVFEYFREQKMKEAKNLLAETQISAQDIGLQLGFSSGANFSTAFKDYFGMTPAEFRSQKTS